VWESKLLESANPHLATHQCCHLVNHKSSFWKSEAPACFSQGFDPQSPLVVVRKLSGTTSLTDPTSVHVCQKESKSVKQFNKGARVRQKRFAGTIPDRYGECVLLGLSRSQQKQSVITVLTLEVSIRIFR